MQFQIDESPFSEFRRLALDGGRYTVFASGNVESGDHERFLEFVEHRQIGHAVICFNSPGGNAREGLRLGREIRRLGFDTDVRRSDHKDGSGAIAICASAAAYAYAGGVFRYIDDSAGRIGLHQFAPAQGEKVDHEITQFFVAELIEYFSSMAIDISTLMIASRTQSAEMDWLGETRCNQIGLSNNGVLNTTSEIKVVDGSFYLRLEQITDKVTARFLLHREASETVCSGGIVTSRERTEELFDATTSSYFEFDLNVIQKEEGEHCAYADDQTIWVSRLLTNQDLHFLKNCSSVGIRTENGGQLRWGAILDLIPVKQSMLHFLDNTEA